MRMEGSVWVGFATEEPVREDVLAGCRWMGSL